MTRRGGHRMEALTVGGAKRRSPRFTARATASVGF